MNRYLHSLKLYFPKYVLFTKEKIVIFFIVKSPGGHYLNLGNQPNITSSLIKRWHLPFDKVRYSSKSSCVPFHQYQWNLSEVQSFTNAVVTSLSRFFGMPFQSNGMLSWVRAMKVLSLQGKTQMCTTENMPVWKEQPFSMDFCSPCR